MTTLQHLSPAQRLNADCRCLPLDRAARRRALEDMPDGAALAAMIEADRPHLFSDVAVFVDSAQIERMAQTVAAIERVVALPAYRAYVLADAPAAAHHATAARGVFLGYDFHLGAGDGTDAGGPQLIEINTNAGGGLLNALLARAERACCAESRSAGARATLPGQIDAGPPENMFMDMFRAEWRAERVAQPLESIAIVDATPASQYLYPEFLMFQHLFERHGIRATICAPEQLEWRDGTLRHAGRRIDLVYNRLTDFALDAPESTVLRAAWLAGGAVVTPHPQAHALYADKRNLVALSDAALLAQWGVDDATCALLAGSIPRTERVVAAQAEVLWARRRQLFFKPATGYGSKAAYRGDKLTRRVFEEILAGADRHEYVAQRLIPPSSRRIALNGATIDLKFDLRAYAYAGSVQLVAARLWQGQTTNFRTPGGGFAPVLAVPHDIAAERT